VDLRQGDCHAVAARVVAELSPWALSLAFVDPEGFEVRFALFETLATRRIDILYLFPGGIGVARNLGAFVKQTKTPLDDLIPGWRSLRRAKLAAGERLSAEEMTVYHLLFFSQHPVGLELWRGVTQIEPSGQRQLRF